MASVSIVNPVLKTDYHWIQQKTYQHFITLVKKSLVYVKFGSTILNGSHFVAKNLLMFFGDL